MAKLTNRYALALLQYAEENNNLERVYRQALSFSYDKPENAEPVTDEVQAFIEFVLQGEVKPVMQRFVEVAREKLGIINAVVRSAAPLKQKQLDEISAKLEKQFGKKAEITTEIDKELLGGFMVIVGDLVVDYSIKRMLTEMKNKLYEGVSLV